MIHSVVLFGFKQMPTIRRGGASDRAIAAGWASGPPPSERGRHFGCSCFLVGLVAGVPVGAVAALVYCNELLSLDVSA